tara:strand:+ start:94 stop:330 length:237 start_codon:yes stop_codon:yes gene_type:complete
MKKENKIKWIDSEIELPKSYVPVLVCFKDEWLSAIRTGYWCGDTWIVNGNKPILTDKISYWMDLPNPPSTYKPKNKMI